LLNKPKGFITTTIDDRSRPTVLDLLTDIEDRVFPVGRLDADTTGALILTNDGDFAQGTARPEFHIKKLSRARVVGTFSKKRENLLKNGIDIGRYTTKPAEVKLIKQMPRAAIVEIAISEGKNRQIRKMFSAVGNDVIDLERIAIGPIYLGGLKLGHYRKLTRQEIEGLRRKN
jgi:23S rRNA pseudouridine2605 synthase